MNGPEQSWNSDVSIGVIHGKFHLKNLEYFKLKKNVIAI